MAKPKLTADEQTNRNFEAGIIAGRKGLKVSDIEDIANSMERAGIDSEFVNKSVKQNAASINSSSGENKG